MGRHCDLCGKGVRVGNVISRHGLPKAKGGIGLHTTGINKRKFIPNLQRIRIIEKGSVVTRKVCTACIKSDRVKKA